MAQTIQSVSITSSAGRDQTYSTVDGDKTITATVRYTEDVSFGGGTVNLALVVGSSRKSATCTLDGSADFFTCSYDVVFGDLDSNGVSIPANALSGTVNVGESTDAAATGHAAVGDDPLHKVDGVRAQVKGVAITSDPGANGAYTEGDQITATVTFTEPVKYSGTVDSTLTLTNGAATSPTDIRRMTLLTTSFPTTTLDYRVGVLSSDNADQLGVKFAPGSTITDGPGNRGITDESDTLISGDLALPSGKLTGGSQRIDNRGPMIQAYRIDTPPKKGTDEKYYVGRDQVDVVVTFNEDVAVAGTPRLKLSYGASGVITAIPFRSTSGRESVFRWTVPDGLLVSPEDGIQVPASPLITGSADKITDTAGNDVDAAALATAPTRTFGYGVDSIAPTVNAIAITAPGTVAPGGAVEIQVTYTENVDVTSEPSLSIRVKGSGKTAKYSSHDAAAITYRYTLVTGDFSGLEDDEPLNVSVAKDAVSVSGIKDLRGNAATRGNDAVEEQMTVTDLTDQIQPQVVSVAAYLPPASGKYGLRDKIAIGVLFSEDVRVAGTVKLKFTIDDDDREATYRRVSGARIIFEYTVKDTDSGDIAVSPEGAISLASSSASILDGAKQGYRAGEPPESAPDRVDYGDSVNVQGVSISQSVDTAVPTVVDVDFVSTAQRTGVGGNVYWAGDEIKVKVTMSEAVNIDGRPKITLKIESGNRSGVFLEQNENNKAELFFRHLVLAADKDIGGIGVVDNSLSGGTITDDAGNLADRKFVEPSVKDVVGHGVDGTFGLERKDTLPTDPVTTPAPIAIDRLTARTSGTVTNGFHKSGATITFTLSFKDPGVDITAPPNLRLDVGGREGLARCSGAGTGVRSITCSYTVQSGDEDTNGISVTGLSGGTIKVGERDISRSLPSVSGLPSVDARAPVLGPLRITSSAGSDGTYIVGQHIDVTATFSEPVRRTATEEEPKLTILIGSDERTARLRSPSSSVADDEYVFRYTVADGDNGDVTIEANALESSLQDAAGNPASDDHAAVAASRSHRVDTKAPSIVGVPVITGHDNNLFVEGSTITATITFDEEVDVTTTGSGAVEMRFNIGTGTGSEREARYVSGDGSEMLTFSYVVVEGDSGPLSVPADAIVGDVTDAAGNEAGVTPAVMSTPYTVDAAAPMLVVAPFITSTPPNGDTYVTGDPITVQVGFDEPVVVDGTPRIYLTVGPRRRFASFVPGDSGANLTFSYTVRPGDTDDDGVSIAANELKLTSGATIKDIHGLSVASSQGTVAHPAVPDQSGHKVDAVAPGIESVTITSTPVSDDAYLIDETIEVTVTFSEDIATDGTPMLGIKVGTDSRAAACAQGGAGTQLTCSYTVVANDFDPDGISVDADSLEGTITDMPGNPATLTHEALADDPAHKVYAAAPEVVGTIGNLSLAAGGGTNSLDLTRIFTGFQLSYAVETSNANVATATVSGTDLTVVSGMEGTARVTVTASNLAGEASASFDVLVATDPVETAVLNDALAAIGRSMLSSTASVIGSRFELASTGSQMALGGSRFGGSLSPQMQRFLAGNDPFALEERLGERALFSGSGTQQAYGGGYGLTADRLLTGTSFNMPLNAMGTGDAQFAVWGAGDLQSFEGEPDDGMYDGSSSSGYIGVDARGDGWLAGVSVSRSGAEADYDFDGTARVTGVRGGGTLETSVTAFHPYARMEVGADSEVWVIGGFGGGEADLSRTHVSGSQSSDLSMAMAVGGLRRALAMEFGGADLSLRGDAGFLSLETDSGAMAVDGLSASVSRLRLGLEAAWEGESATPFVEVSGRFDGGDGQTGGGLELAGGLRILNPESGFGLEAKGRILAMHTGDGYSESGIGVTASFEPGAAGRGITFRLSPRWGGSADSTDLFWDEVGNVRDASQYAYGLDRAQTWGVDAALGYGFGLRSMPGVVTPFGQMDVTGDQDQRIRVGVRYGLMQGLLGGTQVELSAERVDGEMHRVGETRVLVSGRARF